MEKERLYYPVLMGSALFLFVAVVLSTGMGFISIPFHDVIAIVVNELWGWFGLSGSPDPLARSVVIDIRLPRVLTAAIVGGSLAISGAVFQGILQNPLADPYTLGISAGAAFGACLSFLFGGDGFFSVTVSAFLGGLTTLFFVIFLSVSDGRGGRGGYASNTLILSGIIVSSILSAGISFMKYLADEQVSSIVFWLMGSFASKTWGNVAATLLAALLGGAVFMVAARDLNLIALGDKTAQSLGINPFRVTLILLVSASLVTAVAVSVSGIIGFIGLLIPHMARIITGPDNRRLIPLSFFFGGGLMVLADTVTRAVLPHEIPIGVLTALIGGPVFCLIFKREHLKRRRQS